MKSVENPRRANRIPGYDYSQEGWYFVTICTQNRENFFGEIRNGEMVLNPYGIRVNACWIKISQHFPHVVLDEFVIMPNHMHGIVVIKNKMNNSMGNKDVCSLQEMSKTWQTNLSGSLSSIIRGFKIGVTKYCHEKSLDNFAWQKSFYDHVIRNEKSLNNIRQYIIDNPRNWDKDELFA